jgi:RNA polymerase sigma-70 factor (ECF subfamily)
MATTPLERVLRDIRGAAARQEAGGLADGDLLELFRARRDEPAFAELVRRHGPMVLGVCRRVLRNAHDAEDAFQATFLVLVRRAASVRPRDRVGSWLYGVAYRTALEARRAAARRRAREAHALRHPVVDEPLLPSDLWPLLEQELRRLPDKYRAPLLLCDLEGRTRKEASAQLGWAEGTVSSRLARARSLLARRLLRRGVVPSAGAAALVGVGEAARAAVPSLLVKETVQAALLVAAGRAVGSVPAPVAALMRGVLRAMWMSKLRVVAVVCAGVLAAAGVLGLVARHTPAAQPAAAPRQVASPADGPDAPAPPGEEVARADKEEAPAYSVESMPPVVVRTEPQAGDTRVDAKAVTEVRVTFSKKMMDGSWSWSQVSDDTFPKVTAKPHYDKDQRTCVLPVKLEPRKTYVFWLNSAKFHNFKDADGHAAVPYLLVFETKVAEASKTCSVSGHVIYKGKPVSGGTITFHPDQGKPISAAIQEDGSFAASNVPLGALRVSIDGGKKLAIPKNYSDPRRTSLVATILEEKQNFEFDLD